MLKFLSRPAVKLVERYLPDPYIFVLLLTLVAAVAAIAVRYPPGALTYQLNCRSNASVSSKRSMQTP